MTSFRVGAAISSPRPPTTSTPRWRGVVFQPDSVNVIAELAPLYFTVDANDELTFYERQPWTWTAFLEKRAARQLARAAPRPPRVPAES